MTTDNDSVIDASKLGKPLWLLVCGLVLGSLAGVIIVACLVGFAVYSSEAVIASEFGWFGFMILILGGWLLAIATTGCTALILMIFVPLGAVIAGFLHINHARNYASSLFRLSPCNPEDPLGASVARLSARLGLAVPPGAMWIQGNVINAFAMGTNRPGSAVVAIGAPFRTAVDPDELDAIIGHELGHIAYNDVARSLFFRSFQNWLGFVLVFYELKVIARRTLTLASEVAMYSHSRRREYYADAVGALLTSKAAMIGALRKIDDPKYVMSRMEEQYATLMFRGFSNRVFSTHPSTADRILALENETYMRRIRVKAQRTEADNLPPTQKLDGI